MYAILRDSSKDSSKDNSMYAILRDIPHAPTRAYTHLTSRNTIVDK